MIRTERDGLAWHSFDSFRAPAIVTAVFTRNGGVSQRPFASLNVGGTVGDDPARVQENHRRILEALGARAEQVVTAQQVHGDQIMTVSSGDGGRTFAGTDALISRVPGLFLLLRFADCLPVFLYAPRQRAIGLAHAGWKGTLQRIAAKTALAMQAAFGCAPADLYVGLGPAIGPCCMKVDGDVLADFRAQYGQEEGCIVRPQPEGKAFLNLWRINALQLQDVGVTRIEKMEICTSCHRDEFFSHRAENGKTGRFAAMVGIAAELGASVQATT